MVADRMALLHETADAVAAVLRRGVGSGMTGTRSGQYVLDVAADEAALRVLRRAGVGVLSEESGLDDRRTGEIVVIDPVDGSTNCARGVPWYATSLCLVDREGPSAALVVNQANGVRWWAERDGGAFCDGTRLTPSACTTPGEAIVGMNGIPPRQLGWAQCRVLGASALDLCLVAAGALDAYIDTVVDAHGVWDFAGATLICREAGAVITDAFGRELVALSHEARRTPVAAGTSELHGAFVAERRTFAIPPAP